MHKDVHFLEFCVLVEADCVRDRPYQGDQRIDELSAVYKKALAGFEYSDQ